MQLLSNMSRSLPTLVTFSNVFDFVCLCIYYTLLTPFAFSQLYLILLEVEEAEKVKTTVSDKEEESQLMENIKRKVEQLYNELRRTNLL